MKFSNFLLAVSCCLGLPLPTFSQGTVSLPSELAESNAEVIPVKIGLSYSEGPAVDSEGNVFFSENPDVNDGQIWKISPDGGEEVFYPNANGSNGLEFGPQGRLHSCQYTKLVRWELNGDMTELVSDSKNGQNFQRINDLSIGSNGSIYFTNLNGGKVFHLDSSGNLKSFDYSGANGVEWVEEKNTLYICYSGRLNKCTPEANGDISNCQEFTSGSGPDGLTLDEFGNIYLANWNAGRVRVFDSTGSELGYIEVESEVPQGKRGTNGLMGNTSNCIFGGPEGKTLYITGDGGLYKVEMNVKGRQKPWIDSTTAVSKEYYAIKPGLGKAFFLTSENFNSWFSQLNLKDAMVFDMAGTKMRNWKNSQNLMSGAYSLFGTDKNGKLNQLSLIISP